ncbi:hypothetical protein EVAR_35253_1 [Eumeta japonica]|uniref:Uncharacterized protein n=1 Tax=Eumeta variegata TaxID=151549 RepID=A0A4C1VEK2_EUMVA|nr:hypothetical protein EVAR_35253_1 [Eumeta japonica]
MLRRQSARRKKLVPSLLDLDAWRGSGVVVVGGCVGDTLTATEACGRARSAAGAECGGRGVRRARSAAGAECGGRGVRRARSAAGRRARRSSVGHFSFHGLITEKCGSKRI